MKVTCVEEGYHVIVWEMWFWYPMVAWCSLNDMPMPANEARYAAEL